MAAEQAHLLQAYHNVDLAQFLAQEMKYKDWVITVAFYAAVHFVEANFAKRFGTHGEQASGSSPHIWRLDQLKAKGYPLSCRNAYRNLYTTSRQVRYLELWDPNQPTVAVANDYFSDEVVRSFLADDLKIIRDSLGY